MSERLDFSLIVPVYNDGERFKSNYPAICAFLNSWQSDWELVVVDDGSNDGLTPQTLKNLIHGKPRVRILHLENNLGQGAAVKMGMLVARGRIVAYTDADISTPLDQLKILTAAIEEGADMAIGSRWNGQSEISRKQPWLRRHLGKIYYAMIPWCFGIDVKDTNCGFKAYRRETAMILFGLIRSWRWVFNLEHIVLAGRLGFTVREIPVPWRHEEGSKVRLGRDLVFTLWEMALLKLRLAAGIYPRLVRK